jgi:hypothetical protein
VLERGEDITGGVDLSDPATRIAVLRLEVVDYVEVALQGAGNPLLSVGAEARWFIYEGRFDRGTVVVDRRPMAVDATTPVLSVAGRSYQVRRLPDGPQQQVQFEITAKK